MEIDIRLKGSTKEMYLVLEKLREIERFRETPETIRHEGESSLPQWIEEGVADVFWGMSFDAVLVLQELAKGPDQYPRSELIKTLEIQNENALGGILSSPTRQKRIKVYSGYPNPVHSSYVRGVGVCYELDPVWKKSINKMNQPNS